ncbi:MFS transporter [Nocardioides sp. zg-579]|uniref:MFS transporter n=1 Tax=Nocardioides marmotae TaxID=2663857 RepID=A0A6I3JCM5_9ACTN|nr:MFS transporter [Nocardioides marmotae]MCR6032147.1 MFS transporter [Gordonia jinghuaiqii]MTB95793.1 MFS transporter [Nocardioides marmotae]QKE02849.1 MFS transporter [Nocardioides marmotae]
MRHLAEDPPNRPRARLGRAAAAIAGSARNPDLRRAQLSFLAAWSAEWSFTVALGIVAYRDGGPTAVGLVGLLRMAPAAVLAPLLSPLADRGRRERVLVAVSLVRGIATGACAVVLALSGPIPLVYLLAVVSTMAATLYRPAHSALLPSLCRTGYELASANVVRGLLDSAASLIGPLLAAVLLGSTGVTSVFVLASVASIAAAGLVVGLKYDAPPRPAAEAPPPLLRSAVVGLRAVSRSPDLALIMGLAVVQTLTRGALTVLTVVIAIDLLDTGESGVGLLNAGLGAGAVLGSLGASLLVDTRRLGGWFAVGVALWGLPVALIAAVPQQAAALALLAFVGVGNALIDLGGFTLLGRIAPDDVLARVFGVLESLVALSMGVGALAASYLVEGAGVRVTLVAVGALCPLCAVLSWPRLRRMDGSLDIRDRDIATLREVPMLGALPLPSIEQLARGAGRLEVPAGQVVFRQGDLAEHYYVIESGRVEVVGDGTVITTLGPGEGFGEVALVRQVPRTATVRTLDEVHLQSLQADRFRAVVLGFPPSARDAGTTVDSMLTRYAPRGDTDA